MTIHFKTDVIKDDILHLATLLPSAFALRNLLCSKEKPSTWKILGICLCGRRVLFDMVAIFRNGAIIRLETDLDHCTCPHCQKGLSRHTTVYDGVHSHHAPSRN
jgi:hypothetical protein